MGVAFQLIGEGVMDDDERPATSVVTLNWNRCFLKARIT